jgi:methylmalonyl-CoA epimerase
MKPRVRRIDHVGIVVRDAMTSSRWWTERLGMSLTHVADVLDGSIRLAYLDLGDTTVQLVQPLRGGPLTDWLDTNGEGLHHICFLVDGDVRDAVSLLDDQGERHVYQGGRGAEVTFLGETPCGVLIELTEVTAPSWSPDVTTSWTLEKPAPSS